MILSFKIKLLSKIKTDSSKKKLKSANFNREINI